MRRLCAVWRARWSPVPFVTADALARMCEANSEQRTDHVLLEWWLALVLAKAEGATLRHILPIFCDELGQGVEGGEGRAHVRHYVRRGFQALISVFCWLAF